MFGGRVFRQTVGLDMGTKCVSLLVDLFLYSYETYFVLHVLLKESERNSPYLIISHSAKYIIYTFTK